MATDTPIYNELLIEHAMRDLETVLDTPPAPVARRSTWRVTCDAIRLWWLQW